MRNISLTDTVFLKVIKVAFIVQYVEFCAEIFNYIYETSYSFVMHNENRKRLMRLFNSSLVTGK
jgi:hypothetical protein